MMGIDWRLFSVDVQARYERPVDMARDIGLSQSTAMAAWHGKAIGINGRDFDADGGAVPDRIRHMIGRHHDKGLITGTLNISDAFEGRQSLHLVTHRIDRVNGPLISM